MPETNEEARKRYEQKDRKFAELKLRGDWPSKSCHRETCKAGGCCVSSTHHVGDCCLHCGNDERVIPAPPTRLPEKNVEFSRLRSDLPVYVVHHCFVAGDGEEAAVVCWSGSESYRAQAILRQRVELTKNRTR